MANENKSCAAKLHFIRIFYWRLFLIYIKLRISSERAREKARPSAQGLIPEKEYFSGPSKLKISRLPDFCGIKRKDEGWETKQKKTFRGK